jgi:hypothetical protein
MGLIHKTKFVPFIDVSTTTTPSWKQIKKSTTFSIAFNPQTKTFDFISSENPEEEIDSYQPALSQSLTMFDDEDDFKTIFDMAFNLPTGGEAHRNVLLAFYASKCVVPTTYAPTEDVDIVEGKTYYTRSGTSPNYVYTPVAEPEAASLDSYYEATEGVTYYKAWKVDSVVKLGTLDSVNQSIDFDLALNEHETGAVTVADGVPTWVPGTWAGDVFTPAA